MIAVSACLCGVNCKYNGGNNFNETIYELFKEGKAVLICPEQLGGLETPRSPSEIIKSEEGAVRVVNKKGIDVTKEYKKGAKSALEMAKEKGCHIAILKAKSPSCGLGKIYDGTFTGKIVEGNGVTAQLFLENGIKVLNEADEKILEIIKKETAAK
ncbi:MAG TPA: DUF523 domain-containing protein [Clostridiaceae bacterium]|mgnify:FL=1|jgi:uncharacterized protein YbbK (DUF523 family)|nr:DUF523 domain-containing protein [Clostridiaceae bacterium]HBF76471.1 DUF523 domain-containing protein [Clostridiaceae bacterium]